METPTAESLCKPLPEAFFQGEDVVQTARALLGCYLVHDTPAGLLAGRIVETEAYNGPHDRACHAYGYRRTARTETMYLPGGAAYVYLCYGMYELFNVVTHRADEPYAVLIRGLEPVLGIDQQLHNRNLSRKPSGALPRNLSGGPGLLTRALGITRQHNGHLLHQSGGLWVASGEAPASIVTTTRIGVDYAGDDALLPYRFYIDGNPFVSRLAPQKPTQKLFAGKNTKSA